jgi:hypothetical protein
MYELTTEEEMSYVKLNKQSKYINSVQVYGLNVIK